MNVVVFGGSGFIGSHVCDALSERGHKVTIFDIRESRYRKPKQAMIVGDLLDEKKVAAAVKEADAVYNFAGIADLDSATTKPIETIRQNVLGNAAVLNACVGAKVKRFVYASTVYVYSAFGGFYRCSKQASETYIEEYQRKYGLAFTVLRYGTVYGPRSDGRNSIYRYIRQALGEKKITCTGTGDELREYIHVKDAAKLSTDIIESDEYENQYVNITGHHPIRFRDMLSTISEMLDGKVAIELRKGPASMPHYSITPYSFSPRIGRKLVSNHYIDLGQGLLEMMEEIQKELKPNEE